RHKVRIDVLPSGQVRGEIGHLALRGDLGTRRNGPDQYTKHEQAFSKSRSSHRPLPLVRRRYVGGVRVSAPIAPSKCECTHWKSLSHVACRCACKSARGK